MFNKKIITVITTIIIIGISLTAVGLFSSTEPQSEVIEDSDTIKITGKYAEAICDIVEIPCPENVEFDSNFAMDNNNPGYHYASKKADFIFWIIDERLDYQGKRFIDGEWQVVTDRWTTWVFDGMEKDESSSMEELFENNTFGNDYDEYGLRINFVELREINLNSMIKYKDYSTTKIDENSFYTFVIEVQNRDGIEKDFYGMTSWVDPNGDHNGSGMKGTIGPYETMLVDTGGSNMYPGEIPVDVILYEHLSVRKDATPLSQVFVLEEKENEK